MKGGGVVRLFLSLFSTNDALTTSLAISSSDDIFYKSSSDLTQETAYKYPLTLIGYCSADYLCLDLKYITRTSTGREQEETQELRAHLQLAIA